MLLLLGLGAGAAAQSVQPGYDTIRVDSGGKSIPYVLWIQWSPLIVTAPDGGAWAFFSAEPRDQADGTANPNAGRQGKLYTAHFDPKTGSWSAATAMEGGEIQFGPSAVVAKDGTVHLIFSDRAKATSDVFSVLMYTHTDKDGKWAKPVALAPSEAAGHQVAAKLAIDGSGGLHVVWQDQRKVDASKRTNANDGSQAVFADTFESDLVNGKWTDPKQLDKRSDPNMNTNRPQIAVDKDRLVVIWSVYNAKATEDTAVQALWTWRPLNDPNKWSDPQPVWQRGNDNQVIGGRLVDMAADPTGGVVAVYSRLTNLGLATPSGQQQAKYDVYVKRLPAGSDKWGNDILVASGDRGAYPQVAVANDGTVYVVYNLGHGPNVAVGAVALAPKADKPGPEVNISQGEEGGQGIPSIAVDNQNRVWVLYMREPPSGAANEIRCVRGAVIPAK